jgi:hypothetical protein
VKRCHAAVEFVPMEVTSAYLYIVNTLPQILESVQRAQVPAKFTNSFLQALGYKSTNDRAFINVWKGLGFLDGSSTPTESYKQFRDKAIAKAVLARQIRLAYKGLFSVDENAQNLSMETVKGKLATITGKDETVVKKMAQTFKALCKEADFTATDEKQMEAKPPADPATAAADVVVESPALDQVTPRLQGLAFSHTIYINLPATRDIAIYDAIFKSIREHLL